jgi:hypothetical protein
MSKWLKQSTAVDIVLGPFLDDTDGKTAETALTISQADVRLKKNGGAWAQKNQASSATHEEFGYYEASLDATDTNTLGILRVAVAETGALPVWEDFMVVPANVYDALIGNTDQLQIDVTQINGSTSVANKLEKAASTMTIGTVAASSTTSLVNTSDVTEATSDHYKDATLIFITGALAGQRKTISAYNGTTKAFTLNSSLTEAPTAGDTFIVV